MTSEPAPKDRFTSLDTYALVRELRALGPARVDKVFDARAGGVALLFRAPGRRSELTIVPGRYATLLAPQPAHAETLGPLARELRRLLAGCTLHRVSEPGGERYLELEFGRSSEPEPIVLAAELFGTGNLVLARGGTIVVAAHGRRWAHRDVRVGAPYARPPARDDPWTLSATRIRTELEGSRTDLVSTLGARLSLGGPVAEEVAARGGWNPQAPAASDAPSVAERVQGILGELVREIGDTPRGHLVARGRELLDASPFRSHRWDGAEGVLAVERDSFSEAAAEYFASLVPPAPSPEEASREAERAALKRLAGRQERAADELRAAVQARKDDADAVYAHYAEVERRLAEVQRAPDAPRSIELDLTGRSVSIPTGHGVEGAARSLYEEAKRLAAKLAGADGALAATRARLASEEFRPRPTRSPATSASASKVRWFEKYRWFVSSDGVLVIAGRDAASNDVVVRRHLRSGDVYLHADLQGAASVVVKRPQGAPEIPATTLREAAQWAVAYSKAWRAGLASASAFWASPDQVSKSAETGEFVPKGAWIVRGTKHFERDLPLELALGTVRYLDEERWTAAPPSAVRARGRVRVLVAPGEERERGGREEELVRELGVSRSVLQRLLPAGGLSILRA